MSNSIHLCLLKKLIVEIILIFNVPKPKLEKNYFISPLSKAENFNQMIIGLILGLGTLIRKYEKGNTSFKYAQSLSHIEYIHHIFNIFLKVNYCNITKLAIKEIIVNGNIY